MTTSKFQINRSGSRPAKHYPTPDDDDKALMMKLHREGHSIRGISKHVGWSFTTVSKYLRLMGADTDRGQTAEATAARMRQLAERRVGMAEDLMDTADALRERIWDEYEMVSNGPDGAEIISMTEPPLPEQAHGIKAISSAVETVDRLLAGATNPDMDEAKNVIVNIVDGLEKVFQGAAITAGVDDADLDGDYNIHEDPDQVVDVRPDDPNQNPNDWEYEEYDDFFVPDGTEGEL